MRTLRHIALALALAGAAIAAASPPFATKRLARIAAAAGVNVPEGAVIGMADDSTWTYRGRRLRVRTNAFGEVSHVGYRLFDSRMADAYRPMELLDFLERYALELDLRLDGREPVARMAIDKVACVGGTAAMLSEVGPGVPFTVEEIERRMFRVGWTVGGRRLTLTFPADCQLVLGANAAELEDIFERNVRRAEPLADSVALAPWAAAKTYRAGGYVVAEGGQYLSKLIRADLYLAEGKAGARPLADPRKPVQTATNLLLTGIAERPTPLRLTVNRYGYSSTKADVTLQQFVAMCLGEGCRLYVGVKTHTDKELAATIFALNTKLAYNHVLSIRLPLSLLSGGEGVAEATAYAYIPLQNVTEDFFTKDLK